MIFVLLFCFGVVVSAIIPASEYPNIVVIPDMHGDSEALLLSLYSGYFDIVHGRQQTPVAYTEFQARFQHVVNTQTPHPSGPLVTSNDVAVVQLGDLVDRGKYSLQCLVIMRAITTVTGFKVYQVLGNHELAPAIDVNALFVSNRNPKDDFDWASRQISRRGGILYNEVFERFNPIVRLDGGSNVGASTLFVHAGIPLSYIYSLLPTIPTDPNALVHAINTAVKWDLYSEKSNSQVLSTHLHSETIFMTRRYLDPKTACEEIGQVLEMFQVSRIVVGHMADMDANSMRPVACPGLMDDHPVVVLADVGASRYMYGFDLDENSPSPGAILMQLEPSTGALASMDALFIDPTTFSIIRKDLSAPIPPVAKPQRIVLKESDITKIGNIVFQDEFVTINAVSLKESEGYLLNMTNFKDSHFVDALTNFQTSMDEDDDEVMVSFDLPQVWIIEVNNRSMLFVESGSTEMIMSSYNQTITPHTAGILQDIFDALHNMDICAGLFVNSLTGEKTDMALQLVDMDYTRRRFLDFFVISQDGNSIDFVNFSRIRICSKAEAEEEMEYFIDAFHDELTFTEARDEEDQDLDQLVYT